MVARPRRARILFPLWAGVGLVLAGLLLTAGVIGYGAIQNYLRSENFGRLVEGKAGAWLRANVKLTPLHWTGASIYVDRADADGLPESAIASMQGQSLRTGVKLRALLKREVSFEPISITRLDLTLKKPVAETERRPNVSASPASWWRPKSVRLDGVQVEELQLKSPWLELSRSVARLERGSVSDMTFTGGQFIMPGLPATSLNKARVRLLAESLHLLSIDLGVEGGGVIEGDGVVQWNEHSSADFRARWREVKFEHILPEGWRDVLRGQTAGTVHYLRENKTPKVTGSIRSENASVGVLPLLKVLADFTGSERFVQVPIQKLSADFSRAGGSFEFENVVIESNGLIRMEGDCRIQNEQIDGVFLVGVSPSVLRWIPASYGIVFHEDRKGFRWTKMKVNGPLSHPNEDLSPRLLAAIPGAVIEKGVESVEQAGQVIKSGVGGILDTLFGK